MSYELLSPNSPNSPFSSNCQISISKPLLPPFSAMRGPFSHKCPQKWGVRGESQERVCEHWRGWRVLEGGVRRAFCGLLEEDLGCFLSLFRGLASWVPRFCWCRISLFVCLLGKIDIGKSVSVSVVSVEKWMVCSFVSYTYYINY